MCLRSFFQTNIFPLDGLTTVLSMSSTTYVKPTVSFLFDLTRPTVYPCSSTSWLQRRFGIPGESLWWYRWRSGQRSTDLLLHQDSTYPPTPSIYLSLTTSNSSTVSGSMSLHGSVVSLLIATLVATTLSCSSPSSACEYLVSSCPELG